MPGRRAAGGIAPAMAASLLAVSALGAAAQDDGGSFRQAGVVELAQALGAARATASMRATVVAPRAGPEQRLILLRDRADYVSTAEMIEKETRIVADELAAIRAYNQQTEAELERSRAEIEALEKAREAARRAKERRLRQKLEAQRQNAAARVDAAEQELATTNALRDIAVEEGGETAGWREQEEALRKERDRLRRMLEQVSQLSSGLG